MQTIIPHLWYNTEAKEAVNAAVMTMKRLDIAAIQALLN
ncbi:VOC family protein [Streptococcus suis]|uniref:Glyoxalase/bleomycin resistance protein/dioxygenase superfamily protein n=1 Tax=Streptococcus suis TaxID=1307 RepID=A0A2I7ZEV1_STRSU|nr:VOC family protein [Streptococcus suis]AUS90938.1 glyoxalase/bleomycin resistance protein/dioxygenase superfamily protein [Streptococcus suis]MCO8205426.1 VOC family protein [Streptococcus suis]MCO8213557.1 VOC family protein [Streptococcus suis]MCO8230849.1 VOC family protein [Streptococcus suis]MCO8239156.1 VOC family protein [Streptococcus suis]